MISRVPSDSTIPACRWRAESGAGPRIRGHRAWRRSSGRTIRLECDAERVPPWRTPPDSSALRSPGREGRRLHAGLSGGHPFQIAEIPDRRADFVGGSLATADRHVVDEHVVGRELRHVAVKCPQKLNNAALKQKAETTSASSRTAAGLAGAAVDDSSATSWLPRNDSSSRLTFKVSASLTSACSLDRSSSTSSWNCRFRFINSGASAAPRQSPAARVSTQ